VIRALASLVTSPVRWGFLLRRLASRPPRGLKESLKTIVLLPRAVEISLAIEKRHPDVVHLFWGHYPCLVGALVRRFVPAVHLSVFLGAYDLLKGFPESVRVANDAHSVWTHARANEQILRRMGIDNPNLHVVYRGVDLEKRRLLRDLRATRVPRSIMTAGRLTRVKGMDQAIRVLRELKADWPVARLVIAGDGPERSSLRELVAELGLGDSVEFLGHVPHREIFTRVCESEVFLLMSFQPDERLPNVVKEAMLCRTLCVTTRTVGIDELIAHGESGFVVEQHDVAAAARHIGEVFAGSVDYRRLTDNAVKHIEERFDVDANMRHYIDEWSGREPAR